LFSILNTEIKNNQCNSLSLQCFDTVGWLTGGAAGL